ncbi:hypothetical protein T08_736 [Trichinella sp. T8]|nr:hypothetical protein T08_736 [Trichinella sp. T8]
MYGVVLETVEEIYQLNTKTGQFNFCCQIETILKNLCIRLLKYTIFQIDRMICSATGDKFLPLKMLILFRSFVNQLKIEDDTGCGAELWPAANVDSAGVGRNGESGNLLEWRLFRTGSYFRQYHLKESLRNGGSTVHMTTLFHYSNLVCNYAPL